MIALIAADEGLGSGPIPIGLAHAGFEVVPVEGATQAADEVERRGAEDCLVLLGEETYCRGLADGGPWDALFDAHERLAVVVVAPGCAREETRRLTRRPHRLLLVDPFDTAAVVAGAIRASSTARRRAQKVSPRGRLAVAKYAS
ncbi:MAG: hypothetical protein R3F35_08875 [Myxococcota bacterium]